MRYVFAFIFVTLLLPTLVRADNPVPEAVQGVGVDEHLGRELPLDTLFSDEAGNVEKLGDVLLNGKPTVIQLGYLSCTMLCDNISQRMLDSLRNVDLSVGADYNVVFISIDPNEQRIQALKKKQSFVRQYGRDGAAAGWHYLVGDKHSIAAITEAIGFKYKWVDSMQQYSHPALLTVVSPAGKIMRYLYGVDFPEKPLRQALVEASNGQIGTPFERVLILCNHFVAAIGANTAAVMFIMRSGGVLTMLLLGGSIVRRIRQEHRAHQVADAGANGAAPPLVTTH